jgi:uncharacterized membrane protein
MEDKTVLETQEINEGKIFAVIGYLWIFCVIPLILKKENRFVLNHSRQGLVIFIGVVGVFIGSIIFDWFLRPGLFIFGVLSLWGIIAALAGKDLRIPLIRDYADKITL